MRRLNTRVKEHVGAARRHDPLSQIATHQDETGHRFDFDSARILARAKQRYSREFLEAWHSTDLAINRHIDLDPCIQVLRAHMK